MAKIFISHSSENKDIVDLFNNIILNAGLRISDNDIVYTSAPEIRGTVKSLFDRHIQKNANNATKHCFAYPD